MRFFTLQVEAAVATVSRANVPVASKHAGVVEAASQTAASAPQTQAPAASHILARLAVFAAVQVVSSHYINKKERIEFKKSRCSKINAYHLFKDKSFLHTWHASVAPPTTAGPALAGS